MSEENTAGYRRLSEDDIQIGKPIAFSVHDENGALLLKKGYVVKNEAQRARLANQKVFIQRAESSGPKLSRLAHADPTKESERLCSPFEWLDLHNQLLVMIFKEFAEGPDTRTVAKVKLLAERIHLVCDKHHDGLLAAIHLWHGDSYSHCKAFHVAALCDALGKRVGLNPSQRTSLICAGLTHDVAMWQLQDEIQTREEPLTDAQWQKIRSHPVDCLKQLKAIGVADPLWVHAVWCHHERLNGSGYPRGLEEVKIGQPARILAIADTFAAMVRPRGDRGKRLPKDALRDIFLSRGEEIDGTLAQLFIKELGMFPPGSACKLVTGEIGVATGPGVNASSPDVEVIFNAAGKPMRRAEYRDTTDKSYAVVELVPMPDHPDLDALLGKMWPKVPKKGKL